ncbi:gfo/Idh/MocA family oxidoreductase [Paenibacillus sp. LMG 31461]|uniref:Gfo/Idh/MocA family oxidoreductase n=1 Tax=Paenibacillus plantarum TaxID=2654975 RepID=A0ABX1XBQ0_9BACL|nr:Gfo/Idh/MocA family oxidoreductase [Paenibacillus plantarum]NOU65404.1 gfo/Idh/MocA family oxidoreductase [Paenibacillus plantarum]
MSKIKVAIIGCGTIASSSHIKAYMANPDAEIKYFCDLIKEKADKAVIDNSCGEAIDDYRIILNDPEIEAVSICTPNHVHASISIDCLRAGKNVLCEKPAARTYAEALEMQKVQHETGLVLNIGVVNRFNTEVNLIKKMIADGDLGELYHVYVSFRSHRSIPGLGGAFTTKSIAGGGALIDWGVHFLDIVMYCAGDPLPKTVSGQAYSKLGVDIPNYSYLNMWSGPPNFTGTYDVDDFVTAMIRTQGPTISLNGAWAQNIGVNEMYIDFIGDKAGIRLQYGKGFKVYNAKDGVLLETTPSTRPVDMFQCEIDAFLDCIRTGEKLPSHIDTVILSSQIIQGIYDSSDLNREIAF